MKINKLEKKIFRKMKTLLKKLFHEQILDATLNYGDAKAVTDVITGEYLSFNNLRNYSNALANFLIKEYNLKKNEIVICFMPNNIFYPIIFLASALIGSPMCGVYSSATSEELNAIIKQTNSRIIFTTSNLFKIISKTNNEISVFVIDELLNQKENIFENQKFKNIFKRMFE